MAEAARGTRCAQRTRTQGPSGMTQHRRHRDCATVKSCPRRATDARGVFAAGCVPTSRVPPQRSCAQPATWRVTRVRADPKRAAQGICTRSPSMPPQGPSGGRGGGSAGRDCAACRGTSVGAETLFATVVCHFQDLPPVTRGGRRAGSEDPDVRFGVRPSQPWP